MWNEVTHWGREGGRKEGFVRPRLFVTITTNDCRCFVAEPFIIRTREELWNANINNLHFIPAGIVQICDSLVNLSHGTDWPFEHFGCFLFYCYIIIIIIHCLSEGEVVIIEMNSFEIWRNFYWVNSNSNLDSYLSLSLTKRCIAGIFSILIRFFFEGDEENVHLPFRLMSSVKYIYIYIWKFNQSSTNTAFPLKLSVARRVKADFYVTDKLATGKHVTIY